MKSYWIYKYLLLLYCVILASCESYYSIIAPGLLKSNRKYTVAVTLYDVDEPCSIRVSITGESFNASETVNVQSFETKLIDFFPPKLFGYNYKLIAEGITGLNFKNGSKLLVSEYTGPNIYIQTDKAVYKPQDLVQFRVVILDEHTRPVQIREPIRVEIMDDRQNRVKQLKAIKLISGVYTGKFKLSKHPVLGTWIIKVTISGKYAFSESKSILVNNYILPKFSVFIQTAKNILLNDGGGITANIYGKYTFDKYVKGNATVELCDTDGNVLQRKNFKITNSLYVSFDTKNYTQSHLGNKKQLKLIAKLTEEHTGITQTNHIVLNVHSQHYSIRIPDNDIELRNNKPFRLKVHVEHLTGAAVLDKKNPVTMLHGNKTYESKLDENGIASFEFEHQPDADYQVMYKDSKNYLPNIAYIEESTITNTDSYLKLKLLDKRTSLGKPIEIEVSSIINIPYLVYTLVGHANILRMEHIKVPENSKKYIIQITPSIEMVPFSYIYVHYIHNGNLRYEELKLSFPEELENQISVRAPNQVKPGDEVSIELRTQPDSYVSILAVDIGVYLLDHSYDIYKSNIFWDLKSVQSYIPYSGLTVYPGLTSGVITLTNAHFPIAELSGAAGGSGGGSGFDDPVILYRKKFPETWIFQNIAVNQTNTNLTLKVPDSITTWRITAFSNNLVTGFGIVGGPTDIIAIKQFFVTLNLPYSVKKGEVLHIPVTIFNYHKQPLDAQVILYNKKMEFEFMESETTSSQTNQQQQKKQIKILSDGGETVSFLIKPKKLGKINIRVSATSSIDSDAINQKLKVEPAGVTKHHNQAKYLSVAQVETFDYLFNVDIPMDSEPDSENITLSVSGDFIVPTLENLNDLVQVPIMNSEQNMVNFASNILILQYLNATGQYNRQKDLVSKLMSYIEDGYQNQLAFRHRNGGFGIFGENTDKVTSTWLTAYVTRFFIKASKYSSNEEDSLVIEPRIIESSLDFLEKNQKDNGEFYYSGYLYNPTSITTISYSAFVLLTFLEDSKYSKKYETTIQKGIQYLNSQLEDIPNVYTLSLVATALSMAKHNNLRKVVDKLQLLSNEDRGLKWWTENNENSGTDVEITAYTLMALLDTPGDYRSILKWLLIEQRNAHGGFKSTHDTVVGLQALVKYSQKFNTQNNKNLRISYAANDLNGRNVKNDYFTVELKNMSMLQAHKLPTSTRYINCNVIGTGNFLMQLSYQYNIIAKDEIQYFLIEPKATLRNEYELDLKICFTSLSKPGAKTDMVVMEANLPSGFRTTAGLRENLLENDLIQETETKNDNSAVIINFEFLIGNVEKCINIAAEKFNEVMMRKPAAILMHDFYNLKRSNTKFYEI